jgi:hypothetical protein
LALTRPAMAFDEAEIITMKHYQTRDYKDENVPVSCSL